MSHKTSRQVSRSGAPHRLDVGAQIACMVLRTPVIEGQAEVAVLQAQARLRQLQEVLGPAAAHTLRQARSSLTNAHAALARSQDRFNQGFIGHAALDDARKAADPAGAQARAAQKKFDTTTPTGSDGALALANLAGAQASALAARARTGCATIKAPLAGTLIARDVGVGDVVQPGKVLMAATVQVPLQRLKSIDQWQTVAEQKRAMPGVQVVSPLAGGSALVVRGASSRAITVAGIDPALYLRIVNVPGKIVRGKADLAGSDILIGTAQSLLALPGGVTSLDVTVHDVYTAEVVAQRITAATGVEADSWSKTNAELFTAIAAQSTSSNALRFFVGLSVASGIASVLAVVVAQKSRETGILRAMGITQGKVMRVVLLHGGLLALAGAVLGSALGARVPVVAIRG